MSKKPAARISDFHVCPKKTGKVPHVGGPIVNGSPNVFIEGLPAAREGDSIVCVGPADSISGGSSSVFINGKPAARLGDSSSHGGVIISGAGTVLIGDAGIVVQPSPAPKSSPISAKESTAESASSKAASQSHQPLLQSSLSDQFQQHEDITAKTDGESFVTESEKEEFSWVKIRLEYDDLWNTAIPFYSSVINTEASDGSQKLVHEVEASTEHSDGTTKRNSDHYEVQEAKQSEQFEPGVHVIENIPLEQTKVLVDVLGKSGSASEIKQLTDELHKELDSIFTSVSDRMKPFNEAWAERGWLTLADGVYDGAVAWGSDQLDLFTPELWGELGDTLSEGLSRGWDSLGEYASSIQNKIDHRFIQARTNIINGIRAIKYDERGKAIESNWLETLQADSHVFAIGVTEMTKLYSGIAYDVVVEPLVPDSIEIFFAEHSPLDIYNKAVDSAEELSVYVTYREEIFALIGHIRQRKVKEIQQFIESTLVEIDPDLAQKLRNSSDFHLFIALLEEDDSVLLYLDYIMRIFEEIPPNFYTYCLGKAGIYIALEVLLVLLLSLISVGAGAAVKAAATSQKIAKYSNMFAKAVSHNKAVQNMRSGLNAVLSAFEQLLALFEKLKKIAIARSKALSTTFTGWTNRTVKKSVSTPKRDDKPPRCRVCGKTGHDTKPVRAGRLNYA
ncbi:PAAR domain-containing protein [Vibrio vulnificus]|uniref:PAAR domain-containing protein n=1 Tax=Vibrio vulnificus TaxID=672 RepID=UPI0005F22FCA|nr:PAAR domain-containing protein [Vibrio vulnificus]ELV8800513.1 PAAR domain-containing protein [Vibrio vulnificus]